MLLVYGLQLVRLLWVCLLLWWVVLLLWVPETFQGGGSGRAAAGGLWDRENLGAGAFYWAKPYGLACSCPVPVYSPA